MLLPFRFGSGAVLGSGKQWMSWIHISDMVCAIRFLVENENCSGPYNLTAPHPVRMKEFIKVIGKAIGRPAWLKVPGIFIKAGLGEMGKETVLASQNIIPGKLQKDGYTFSFPNLEPALNDLLNRK
jgi:hypothetical protein